MRVKGTQNRSAAWSLVERPILCMVLSKIDNARADAALSGFGHVLNRIEAHRSPATRIFFAAYSDKKGCRSRIRMGRYKSRRVEQVRRLPVEYAAEECCWCAIGMERGSSCSAPPIPFRDSWSFSV